MEQVHTNNVVFFISFFSAMNIWIWILFASDWSQCIWYMLHLHSHRFEAKKKKPLSITEKQTKQNQRNYFVIHWKKKFIEFFVSFFISMQSICMQSIRSVTVECYSFIMTIRLIFLIKNKQKKKANKRIFSRLNFFQLFSKEKQSETNGIKFKNLCN